jgi:hypothetical protein
MSQELFETAYIDALKTWTPEKLRAERDGLRACAPKLAIACEAELAMRGLPQQAPPSNDKPGLHMRPSSTIDGRSAIDLWRGNEQVATIYCAPCGLHISFETTYEPGPIEVAERAPASITIAIDRIDQ